MKFFKVFRDAAITFEICVQLALSRAPLDARMRRNVNRDVFNERKNVSATIVGSAYVYPLDTRMRRNVNRNGFNDRENVSATALSRLHFSDR